MLDILLTAITPFVVAGVTQVVKFFKVNVSGAVVTGVLVPVFSGLYTFITQSLLPGTPHWYFQFAYGLVATFIFELQKQLRQPGGTQ